MKQIFIEKVEDKYKTTYLGYSKLWSDIDKAYYYLRDRVDLEKLGVEAEIENAIFYGENEVYYVYFQLLEVLFKRLATIRRQVEKIKAGEK